MEWQGITEELIRSIHTLTHSEGRPSIYYGLQYFTISAFRNPITLAKHNSYTQPRAFASWSISACWEGAHFPFSNTLFTLAERFSCSLHCVLFQRFAVALHGEREHFLPWNQIHNQEEQRERDWISGGWLNLRSFQGDDELPPLQPANRTAGDFFSFIILLWGIVRGQDNKEKEVTRVSQHRSGFSSTTLQKQNQSAFKNYREKDEVRIRTKANDKMRHSTQMV